MAHKLIPFKILLNLYPDILIGIKILFWGSVPVDAEDPLFLPGDGLDDDAAPAHERDVHAADRTIHDLAQPVLIRAALARPILHQKLK